MKYSKPLAFFLLMLGMFSLAMNFYFVDRESLRGPSSAMSDEKEHSPWWITH